ncbi:hypothetical protein D3C71_1948550 [compost metagenome]
MLQLPEAFADHRIYVGEQNEVTDHRPLIDRDHFPHSVRLLLFILLYMLCH